MIDKGTDDEEKVEGKPPGLSQRSAMSKKGGDADAVDEEDEENKAKDPADPELFVRPALFDRYLWCKLAGLLLIFSFWILAIALSFEFGELSGIEYMSPEKDEEPMKRFILLTPD